MMDRQHDRRAPGAVSESPDTLQERMSFAWNHVGGLSGVVLTTVPVLAFVIVNAVYGMWPAIWSSLAGAVVVGAVQVLRREKLTAAFAGLGGAVVSSVITVLVGEAKGRYLWGIWVALVIAIVLLVSVLVRRPLIGLVWAGLNFQDDFWRTDRRSRFYYDVTTLFWSALCFLRFGVQFWLYLGDRTTALGFANILLGTPLTFVSVVVTIWAVRQVEKRRKLFQPPPPDQTHDGQEGTDTTIAAGSEQWTTGPGSTGPGSRSTAPRTAQRAALASFRRGRASFAHGLAPEPDGTGPVNYAEEHQLASWNCR